MMNKRGITEDLPRLIAIVAGILVFLVVLAPPLYSLIKKGGETGKCDWNLLLAAGFKAGTLGFGEIPVGCQAEYATADASTIQKMTKTAKKRITKYCGESLKTGAAIFAGRATSTTSLFYVDAAKEFCPATLDNMNEWAMNALIGKRMAECWNKVWHGKLNFFTQNWGKRNFCVACSIIRFSDDLPAYVNKKQITSLYEWMNAERYYKTTYYDFVKDGQTVKLEKESLYYSTDTPLAVTFMHGKAGHWAGFVTTVGTTVTAGAVGGTIGTPVLGTSIGAGVGLVTGIVLWATGAVEDADVKQVALIPYVGLKNICTDIIA